MPRPRAITLITRKSVLNCRQLAHEQIWPTISIDEGCRGEGKPVSVLFLTVFFARDASATACPQPYVEGGAPVITNTKVAGKTIKLCHEAFAVVHSGIVNTLLRLAEHLLRGNIESAQAMSRWIVFHAFLCQRRTTRETVAARLESIGMVQRLLCRMTTGSIRKYATQSSRRSGCCTDRNGDA